MKIKQHKNNKQKLETTRKMQREGEVPTRKKKPKPTKVRKLKKMQHYYEKRTGTISTPPYIPIHTIITYDNHANPPDTNIE